MYKTQKSVKYITKKPHKSGGWRGGKILRVRVHRVRKIFFGRGSRWAWIWLSWKNKVVMEMIVRLRSSL